MISVLFIYNCRFTSRTSLESVPLFPWLLMSWQNIYRKISHSIYCLLMIQFWLLRLDGDKCQVRTMKECFRSIRFYDKLEIKKKWNAILVKVWIEVDLLRLVTKRYPGTPFSYLGLIIHTEGEIQGVAHLIRMRWVLDYCVIILYHQNWRRSLLRWL